MPQITPTDKIVNVRFPEIFYHIKIGIHSGTTLTNEIFSINHFLTLTGVRKRTGFNTFKSYRFHIYVFIIIIE